MRMMHLASWILGLAVLLLGTAARADEPPKDGSAAAKAYEEAFWQETGAGALDRALEGYRAAFVAEGPEAVRARALYRSAVVLHRMGRTEEAVKALEGLAKGFPGERDLLTEAKARLTDWTAVDLRTSFEEWYRRYRYTPDFQAKVLDLVLALGSPVGEQAKTAKEELLTIGDAAIPALRAHLDSPNVSLRGWAVAILLRLGEVPEPRHLVETSAFASDSRAWAAVRKAPSEIREAILRAATGDSAPQRALRAVAGGRDAILAEIRAGAGGWLVDALVQVLLEAGRDDPGAIEGLEAVALDQAVPFDPIRRLVLQNLVRVVPASRMLGWAAKDDPELLTWLDRETQEGRIRSPDGWRVLLALLEENPTRPVVPGLLRLVEDATPPADPAAVAAAVVRSGHANFLPNGPRGAEVLRRVAQTTEDAPQGLEALGDWRRQSPASAVLDGLLDLARSARAPAVRRVAGREYVHNAPVGQVGMVVSLLDGRDEGTASAVAQSLAKRQDLVFALHTTSLRRLRDLAGEPPATWLWPVLDTFQANQDALVAHVVADPLAVPQGLFALRQGMFEPSEAHLAQIREAWPRYSPEARRALFVGLLVRPASGFASSPYDSATLEFLRSRLSDVAEDPIVKRQILTRFSVWNVLRLADVTTVHDVSTEEGAKALLPLLSAVAAHEGAYAATARLRADPDRNVRWAAYNPFLKRWDATAAGDAVRDADPGIRSYALAALAERRSPEDVPVFRRALADPDADVRSRAAEALGSVWTREAIPELVRLLDDPNPGVRDAALAALDRIAKVESLKRSWELYLQGHAPMPPGADPRPGPAGGAAAGER